MLDSASVQFAALVAALCISAWSERACAADLTLRPDPTDRSRLLVAGQMPVEGEVDVVFVAPDGTTAARLLVWPAVTAPCSARSLPNGARQTYEIPLEVSVADGQANASGAIPHLQVSTTFCLRVHWRVRAHVESSPLRRLVRHRLSELELEEQLHEQDFVNLAHDLAEAACPQDEHCALVSVAPLARTLFRQYVDSGIRSALRDKEAFSQTRDASLADRARLREEASAFRPLRIAAHRLDAGSLPATAEDARALREELRARHQRSPWFEWLERYRNALAAYDNAVEARESAQQQIDTVRSRLPQTFVETATEYLAERVMYDRNLTSVARSTTAEAANYVSPEAGVAIGTSYVAAQTPWLLLYAGLNIYLAPVERTLPLSELVGAPEEIFLQLFSFTIAYAGNTAPDLVNGEIDPVFGDGLPGVGLGFRFAQFLRLGGMAFIFRARSSSPLSQDATYAAAFTLSLSIEGDVIALLTKALSG